MVRRASLGGLTFCIAAMVGATVACGDASAAGAAITAGFAPHHQPQNGGYIDWTEGYIVARGMGLAEGTGNQQRLMAKRAATLDAAANALALAAGIDVSEHGRAGGLRDGRRQLEGVIKGFTISDENWQPQLHPPKNEVLLRVPLWGVKSVSSIVVAVELKRALQHRQKVVHLSVRQVDVSDTVLIIDARGTGVRPCLFPAVGTTGGAVLYDVTVMKPGLAHSSPPVRYVETDVAFDKLQSSMDFKLPRFPNPAKPVCLAAFEADEQPEAEDAPADEAEASTQPAATTQPTTQPATQPATESDESSQRRPRRRLVVKAVQAAGQNDTNLTLTEQDAKKLADTPEGASLMRSGRVVIVVDSAAAGIQGESPRVDEYWLALLDRR